MELIAAIPLIGPILATLIPFIVVLGIVVAVHEYGHYIVGRWCGIHAEVFSIGFGKPLVQWHDKRGTRWQIAPIPLGGYVQFLGNANAASFDNGTDGDGLSAEDRARSFPFASIGRRALTVLAGPVANFILSSIVFAGLIFWQGQAVEEPTVASLSVPLAAGQDLQPGDKIVEVDGVAVPDYAALYTLISEIEPRADLAMVVEREGSLREVTGPWLLPPLVAGVQPLSPASDAGVKAGDLILSIGGKDLVAFDGLRDIVLASEGVALEMIVLRDGQNVPLTITPEITDTQTADGGFEKRVMIGVAGGLAFEPLTENPGLFAGLWGGVTQVVEVIGSSLNGLYHIVTGALGADNLQGPLGIAQLSGESATQGLENFIYLIAVISTAIGMLNLFPIPILDGGHLVIYAFEALMGRPPSEKILNAAMSVGFVLLMALMLFATYNDLMRI